MRRRLNNRQCGEDDGYKLRGFDHHSDKTAR
jgi:hypothetical protein